MHRLCRVLPVCLIHWILQDNITHRCFIRPLTFVGEVQQATAGGALYIITHILKRQIHFVNKVKGQTLIRQP